MSGRAKLSAQAAQLLTEDGYLNAMCDLYERLASGDLTRDECSALIGARRCLESFAAARTDKAAKKKHKELIRALNDAQEALKDKGSGASSFTPDQVQLPRRKSSGVPRK